MVDRELANFLDGVVGVVEANSYERLCLWKECTDDWKQRSDGLLETVGHLDEMPVCLCLITAVVNGHKLLFIDATSQVVDTRMIDKWLSESMPKTAMTDDAPVRVNKVDAMNFHNVFRR